MKIVQLLLLLSIAPCALSLAMNRNGTDIGSSHSDSESDSDSGSDSDSNSDNENESWPIFTADKEAKYYFVINKKIDNESSQITNAILRILVNKKLHTEKKITLQPNQAEDLYFTSTVYLKRGDLVEFLLNNDGQIEPLYDEVGWTRIPSSSSVKG